jgi:hypothetical protein
LSQQVYECDPTVLIQFSETTYGQVKSELRSELEGSIEINSSYKNQNQRS